MYTYEGSLIYPKKTTTASAIMLTYACASLTACMRGPLVLLDATIAVSKPTGRNSVNQLSPILTSLVPSATLTRPSCTRELSQRLRRRCSTDPEKP